MKIAVRPSLDVGRCGIPVVNEIARFNVVVARRVRRGSAPPVVPAADTLRYSGVSSGWFFGQVEKAYSP